MSARKVLITGAFGVIGGALYRRMSALPERFDMYATDRRNAVRDDLLPQWIPDVAAEKFMQGDLADMDVARKTVAGMDTVVHLAANANAHSEFDVILHCNVVTTYNVFEACRLERVKRVVYASSIMTNFGYYSQEPYKAIRENRFEDISLPMPLITKEHPVWPTEPYSASKVWGEALAKAFALKYNTSFHCIRIGAVNPDNRPSRNNSLAQSIWCSLEDITQLIQQCVEAPDSLRFDIFYAISNNRYRWVDTDHARTTVGFESQSCAEEVLGSS